MDVLWSEGGHFDDYRRLEKLSKPWGEDPEFFLPSDLITVIVARNDRRKNRNHSV